MLRMLRVRRISLRLSGAIGLHIVRERISSRDTIIRMRMTWPLMMRRCRWLACNRLLLLLLLLLLLR